MKASPHRPRRESQSRTHFPDEPKLGDMQFIGIEAEDAVDMA